LDFVAHSAPAAAELGRSALKANERARRRRWLGSPRGGRRCVARVAYPLGWLEAWVCVVAAPQRETPNQALHRTRPCCWFFGAHWRVSAATGVAAGQVIGV